MNSICLSLHILSSNVVSILVPARTCRSTKWITLCRVELAIDHVRNMLKPQVVLQDAIGRCFLLRKAGVADDVKAF